MELIQEVLAFSRDYANGNQTTERKQKIAIVYKKVTGENLNIGCGTCYIEALFLIKKFMEKTPCKYQLKPGALLRAFGDESKTCTNKNLTDELAEWHLTNNPGTAKYFAKIPGVQTLPIPTWKKHNPEIIPPVVTDEEAKAAVETEKKKEEERVAKEKVDELETEKIERSTEKVIEPKSKGRPKAKK
jgi:hypothetical protein